MIVIENVRVIGFGPPSVSPPVDVAFLEENETGTGQAAGTLAAVAPGLAAVYPKARRLAGQGRFLSPGLVCAHTHLYSALARGLPVSIAPSKDFAQQLKHLWWRLDRAIDLPILAASALSGCAEAALCGVTSLVDHHASPEAIDGSLSILRNAFEQIGLRGLLCYETSDRNGCPGARDGIRENLRLAREIDVLRASGGRPRVEAAIGAHAGFTIGEETLAELGAAVRDSGRGLHIHLAEDRYDASDSRHRFGADLAVRFDRAGCLGPKTIIAHGVWLSPEERDLVNQRDAFLAHNARSNMNNAVGYTSLLPGYRNVLLGTDGMGADMLEEFKFACFRQREAGGPWWPADFLACLDRANRLLERSFAADLAPGQHFGRIEAGCPADLVLWDYDPPTPLVADNLAGHLAFGLSSRSVNTVVAGGRLLVENGRPAFDAAAIAAHAREQAQRLWKRMEERS